MRCCIACVATSEALARLPPLAASISVWSGMDRQRYSARRVASDPEHPIGRAINDGISAARRRRQELERAARGVRQEVADAGAEVRAEVGPDA